MPETAAPQTVKLADYSPPDWLVPEVALTFALDPARTVVTARLTVTRNGRHNRPLVLDGEELELLSLSVDGDARDAVHRADGPLEIKLAADSAVIETKVAPCRTG